MNLQQGSFLTFAWRALLFPLRPAWLVLLILIPVVNQSAAYVPTDVAGMVVVTVTSLYTLGLVQSIVISTGRGVDLVLPNFTWKTAFGSIVPTIFGWLVVLAVSLGPFVFVHHHTQLPSFVQQVLLVFGLAYFPMSLLAFLQTNRLSLISPTSVLASISRAPVAYAVTALLLVPHLYLAAGVDTDRHAAAAPSWVRFLFRLLVEMTSLYLALYWARVLGLFYRFHRQFLRW